MALHFDAEQFQDFSSFTKCNITTSKRGWGSGGFPPEAEAFFWESRCQMSNFKTLWSIKLHFASRWTKSDEIDVAFCFSKSKVVWLTLWWGLLSTKFWTLVYQVALWSIKLHFGLSSCTLIYHVAFWSIKDAFSFSDQVAFWSIKLYFGLSSCI